MKRRFFLRTLGLITGIAAVKPLSLLPKPGPSTGQSFDLETIMLVPNPEYAKAKYEVFLYEADGTPAMSNITRLSNLITHVRRRSTLAEWHRNWVPYPVRGNEFTKDGQLIPIFPWIIV